MGDSSPQARAGSVLHVSAATSMVDAFSREIEALTDLDVISAGTVNDALEILDTRNDVYCIVSDYDVPDIDGLAFLQSVRAQYPDLPFILFTSEGNEKVASKAISARVTDYLIQEQFHDQWEELAALIEESVFYHKSQRTLADPESRVNVVLETLPDSVVIVQDGSFRYANGNALGLFGIESLETISDRGVIDFISADSQEITTSSLDAIQAGETHVDQLGSTVVGQEGRSTRVEMTAFSIRWRGSKAILLILRDISEREEKQLELRRFKQAVEAAGQAIFITDTDGVIEYVNPAFEVITGYGAEEAIGKTPGILKSGEMSSEYYEELWDTILSGGTWEEELTNQRKNGELYHAHQIIAPITDGEGDIQAFVAIQTDVTERVQQERKLRELKQRRYESMFNSIRDAVLIADTDGKIVNCNPAFTELFGYELDEIEGKPTEYVYESEEEFEEVGEDLEAQWSGSQSTTILNYEKKSGQVFPGETSVYYLRNHEGDVTGFVGLIRDVSERKDRTRQLQNIDNVLRHNIRNEINIVQGTAELIRDSTTGEVGTWAQKIIDTSKGLLETADKARLITELLAGPPTLQTIDLADRLNTAVAEIADSHPAAEITLSTPETCEITASPEIYQALEELIENAIGHSDQEQPTVEISMERRNGMVSVAVADDGPGIPEMEQKVLKREANIGPLYHGSGMGLWLVNLIVQRSDGVLEFDENEPRGSVVTINLPDD